MPPVDAGEMTARFVISKGHVNRQTGTLKATAFLPAPGPTPELSVMRLRETTEPEVWSVGQSIAAFRGEGRSLYGRGDVLAATYQSQQLSVQPDPVDGNPNHALVLGWPVEKEAQLECAKEIAAVAKFVAVSM